MKRALAIAGMSRGDVLPNPMVGAVLVKNGQVIGEGRHARYGGIHAEEAVLRNCEERGFSPLGAELYVTLEPCCFNSPSKHNGPCTEKIINSGISSVFIARPDPNPLVRGRGISLLKNAGIPVVSGVLEKDSAELNRVYEALILKKRPYVHLKAAVTLDGFIAAGDGSSKWISCDESRKTVMKLRQDADALLVGSGTLITDRPGLTVRDRHHLRGDQPLRVVLSSSGRLPEDWPVLDQGPAGALLVYHLSSTQFKNQKSVEWERVPSHNGGLSLQAVLENLHLRGIRSLLVEGGSRVYGSFIRSGLWDRLTVFQSPDLLGRGTPFTGDLGIGTMKDKLVLHHRLVEFSGRDVMIQGDREAFSCLQV